MEQKYSELENKRKQLCDIFMRLLDPAPTEKSAKYPIYPNNTNTTYGTLNHFKITARNKMLHIKMRLEIFTGDK